MKQKLLSETHVIMTVRIYGYSAMAQSGKHYTFPGDIERIIEVNGTPVYSIRTARELDENSMPRRFEQWLIPLTQSMEIADSRDNSRPNRRYFFRCCEIIRRKVFRKFIQFKP